jgi:FHA domain
MLGHGASRRRIARVLNMAYADGLLSEETFARRLDQTLSERLIDPRRLIGDLSLRSTRRLWRTRLSEAAGATAGTLRLSRSPQAADDVLLALDWAGAGDELVIGRSRDCDVVFVSEAVSRRHARLLFRDGHWVIRDLASTNGTMVNGVRVGRCRLDPGDRVTFGDTSVIVD